MTIKSGIYGIYNKINSKIYIGSSNNIYYRKSNHLSDLIKNKHGNRHLQNAFNKYGRSNFSFLIFERIEDVSKLIKRELYWITKKKSLDRKFGYNLAIPDPNCLFKHSEETKELQRKRFKNIIQIDKTTGKFVKEYATTGTAGKEMGYKNNKKIQRALSNETPSYKGFVYVYKEDYDPEKNYIVEKGRQYKTRRLPVFQYSIDGTYKKRWNHIDEVILSFPEFKKIGIYDAIHKKGNHGGFLWSRKHHNLNKKQLRL